LWVDNGTGICTAAGDQQNPAVTCDGAGGTIIAWLDERVAGRAGIFAQRVSASGSIEWTANGIGIRTGAEYELVYAPAIAPDGFGGAVVAWYESRGGGAGLDVYAQRVSASGDLLWTTNGVAICAAAGNQEYPAIVPDGSGGTIIVWNDHRVSNWEIYAQKVDASGAVQWTTDGVAVCAAAGNRLDLVVTSDGAGGAIISWWDDRSGNADVYVQRVDASGTVRWSPQGVPLCTAAGDQGPSQIASDGAGGAIVTWGDIRGGSPDVYAQRVSASGTVQWATNGVAICTSTGEQYWPVIVSDDAGGAIIAWDDFRDGDVDVYAQRVNALGSVQWVGNGVLLCSATGDQYYAAIVSDGASGAIVAWHDLRGGSGTDMYAQRVNGSGKTQWAVDGIPLCTATGDQSLSSSSMVSDGAGGAIVAWNDHRAGNWDVYAKRLCGEGDCVGWPRITAVQDVPRDQGGKLRVQWARSDFDVYRFTEITHYSVWRRLPELAAAALETGDEIPRMPLVPIDYAGPALRRSSGGYSWEWIANVPARYFDSYSLLVTSLYDSMGVDPGWQYFMVTAQTATQYIFYDSPVASGYSVDNLAPHSPSSLAGQHVFAPEGLALVWDMNAESDFSHFAVYRGTSEHFVPGPGNRLAEVTASHYFDGGWRRGSGFYYRVSAVDIHGNESTYALLSPDIVTGNDTPGTPDATYLAQNVPNPFNPTTRITFGLKESTRVSLRIYDVAGRLVRVLVEGDRPAGRYAELWNGCDAVGKAAASGMYFYRLDAGSFTQTRKMILLR
jgi:predicted lipoprotein with Yx(FWY)xxD motif